MKRLLVLSAFAFLFFAIGVGQKTQLPMCRVYGKVVDQNDLKGGVPYATIRFYNSKKQDVKAVASYANGQFEAMLPADNSYTLRTSSVGFGQDSLTIVLKKGEKQFDCGQLVLKESSVNLKAVTVTEQRQLIKVEDDKLIYALDADPSNKGNTLINTFRSIPMLEVDHEDNVKLNGETNFKVLVNGKENSMMNKNLSEVLKSMPSDAVKEIEVITNPSTKYDAEGLGGIINIITHKKALNGVLGSVNLSAGSTFEDNTSGRGSFFLQSKVDKFDYSINYWASYGEMGYGYENQTTNYNSASLRTVQNIGKQEFDRFNHNLNFQSSYEIDSLNLISLSLGGYHRKNNQNQDIENRGFDQLGDTTLYYDNAQRNSSLGYSFSLNADYQRSFRKKDQTLTFSYKLNTGPEMSNNLSTFFNTYNYTPAEREQKMRKNDSEHAMQIDYFDPLTKEHQIEGGMKYTLRNSQEANDLFNKVGSDWILDNAKLNDVSYLQHIISAYGGYLYKTGLFTAKGGFRLEGTINDGTFINNALESPFYKSYFNVVPYLNYSMKVGKTNRIILSYTQRLSRPSLRYLNPYVNDVDPLNISRGNRDLESELSHSVNARYNMMFGKANLNLSVSGFLINNGIENISTVDAQGVRQTFPGNFGKRRNLNMNVNTSIRSIKNLTINANVSGRYEHSLNTFDQNTCETFTYNASLGLNANLWTDGTLFFYSFYNSGWVRFQTRQSPMFAYVVGAQQQFFNKKLRLNLQIQNPFLARMDYGQTTEAASYRSQNRMDISFQYFNISVGYSFGNLKSKGVKKASRSIVSDDRKEDEAPSSPVGN